MGCINLGNDSLPLFVLSYMNIYMLVLFAFCQMFLIIVYKPNHRGSFAVAHFPSPSCLPVRCAWGKQLKIPSGEKLSSDMIDHAKCNPKYDMFQSK